MMITVPKKTCPPFYYNQRQVQKPGPLAPWRLHIHPHAPEPPPTYCSRMYPESQNNRLVNHLRLQVIRGGNQSLQQRLPSTWLDRLGSIHSSTLLSKFPF